MDARRRAPVDPFGLGVDSYNRMSTVLGNFGRLDALDWFRQLGDAWSACDNIARSRSVLRELLSSATRAELDAMMKADERAALAALPERFEVWRGCYAINRRGLSWTLDRSVAEGIVALNRYRRLGEVPILRHGYVRRDRVVLKLDRRESEVIAPRVFRITESRLQVRGGRTPPA